jgi:hypothetical protein
VARRELVEAVAPQLRTIPSAYAERVSLDNAALLARRVYLTDLERFERVFAAQGSDLRRAIAVLIAEHEGAAR